MKFRLFTAIATIAMATISCSEDTVEIGKSLTDEDDKLQISTGIYDAFSRSMLVDSVYAQNFDCYFGQIKDPETGAYVKSEFMTQFNLLEGVALPENSKMFHKDGYVLTDSCEIWLYFVKSKCYGDSLTSLKMRISELSKPMNESEKYYSNYDPVEKGYIRQNGLKKDMMFAMSNLTYADSIRKLSSYGDIIRVRLSDPYTASDGKTYPNYGTYLLQTYYDHPEYYKNSYTFTHHVCPGFFFEITDGLGLMANLGEIDLKVYYRYQKNDTTVVSTSMTYSATSEVLQTCKVTNDKQALQELVDDESCTYLKTPAGIFTELDLPVDEIMFGHFNDSLLTVNMTLQRENSLIPDNYYLLPAPTTLLMIPKDSLYTFFEKEKTYDYRDSFVATLSKNNYTFSNMGNMITLMFYNRLVGLLTDEEWEEKHPNWNKVVMIPVTTYKNSSTTTTTTTATATVASICNNIALTSTRLVGGYNSPIKVNVIYAKFNEKKE